MSHRHLMTAAGADVADWDRRFDDLTESVLTGAELRVAVAAARSAVGDPIAGEVELGALDYHLDNLYWEMLDDAIDQLKPTKEVA